VITLYAIGLVTMVVAATLAGGAVPLRWERHSRLMLSFSAGTLVGLALIELIPEALTVSHFDPRARLLVVLAAFLLTMLLDKLHVLHPHPHGMEAGCPDVEHSHPPLAMHGAVGLLIHSVVDGLALAAALRQSAGAAVAVGVALSAHKFADGLSTVALVLGHHHRRRQAAGMLLGNASVFLLGVAAGLLFAFGEGQLATLLLVMAGFFLYLGATDLIPALTTPVCRTRDVVATALGMAVIALVSALAH